MLKRTIVNAGHAPDIAYTDRPTPPWWQWDRFPLVPIWSIRGADEWNEWGFNFSWLNVRVWTMISPDIGVAVECDDHGLYVRLRVPFLIFHIQLIYFPASWHQKWWRKPRALRGVR